MKIIGVTVGTTAKRPNFSQTNPKKSDYIRNNPFPQITEEDEGKFLRASGGSFVLEEVDAGGVSSWNDLTDKPFGEETGKAYLFEETQCDGFEYNSNFGAYQYVIAPSPFALTLGETYKVIWDGTEYECAAQDMSVVAPDGVGLGNLSIVGGAGNGEPFVIGYSGGGVSFFAFDAAASHTVGIYQESTTVKKIDIKYLPAEIYTEIDNRIDKYIEEALGGDY